MWFAAEDSVKQAITFWLQTLYASFFYGGI
jgi:hypothetical protein